VDQQHGEATGTLTRPRRAGEVRRTGPVARARVERAGRDVKDPERSHAAPDTGQSARAGAHDQRRGGRNGNAQSGGPRAGDSRRREVTDEDRERYDRALATLKRDLGYQESFDILVKEMTVGGRRAALISVDSMVDTTVLTLLMHYLTSNHREVQDLASVKGLVRDAIPFVEVETTERVDEARDQVLAGPAILMVEGVPGFVVIDVRTYPARDPSEPSLERVIRGPRDGFVETLVFNTVLVRRRIRDPRFRIESFQVGDRSKTDVVMMYIKDIANAHFVDEVRRRLKAIKVDGLTMSEKALEEWVMKKPWWNPFPNARFTERPDVAAEHLMQGHVLIMADTSPNAMIVPVTFFSFLQSAEEYHEGVMVGTYLKWVRTFGVLFSLLGPPLWFVLYQAHMHLPGGYRVLVNPQTTAIPVIWQILGAEVGVDLLRLALMFSPNSLSQSMGFFGAVLLGDIAVKAGLLDAEVLVYVAVAAVGTFAAPDLDFGLAIRFWRVVLLVLVAVFELWKAPWVGFGVGLAAFVMMAMNASSIGISYLWPLLPLNVRALTSALSRKPLNRLVLRPALTLPTDKRRQPVK
jgi:stage V sporulation protein AF